MAAGLVSLAVAAGAASSAPLKPAAPTAALPDPQYVEGEILVKFRAEAPAASRGAVRGEVAGRAQRRFASGAELWRLGDGITIPEAIAQLRGAPEVEYAEPNYIVHAANIPNDPLFPQQWPLLNTGQSGGAAGSDIDATGAWDISTGGASVLVAVTDTGLDLDHPDLVPNLWTNPHEIPGNGIDDDGNGRVDDVHGWDFVNHDAEPFDDNGHGTHVSGTIAASGDNGQGVTGVAWRASLMPLKFLDRSGAGNTADAIDAIDYAAASGARIINASWGGGDFSQAMLESIRAAGEREVLFVAAAGNAGHDSDRIPFFPAGYDVATIVAVAASDGLDRLATFSNFGRTKVDLAAPGVTVFSTLPGGVYGFNSGTSMATPHVSGTAALILGFAPGMAAETLRRRLIEQAEPVAGLDGRVASGGRVNALRCLSGVERIPPGPIVDLRVVEPLSDGLVLAWTATGDDGDGGAAVSYDLRIAEEPFDASGFDAAPRAPIPGAPLPAGAVETREIGGLQPLRTYFFGLRAVDEWGNLGAPAFATATTRPAPVVDAALDPAIASLLSGGTATFRLTLSNPSQGTLDWSIERPIQRPVLPRGVPRPERWGGPDGFGYAFADSDEPGGPVFAWRDIVQSGRTAVIPGDDTISEPIPLGFSFPFYGQSFDSVRIASNGFLTFTGDFVPFENEALPSPGAPPNLVAAFWDDLFVPGLQGALWLAEPHAFTVQYDGVLRMNGNLQPYTFQIILSDNGDILFQYLSMNDTLDAATVGIQDATGAAGLSVAVNATYVHDGLAVRLFRQKDWIAASPRSGRLRAGEAAPVTVTVDASGLPAGSYDGWLPVLSNDPLRPRVELPIHLAVEDARAIAAQPASVDFGTVLVGYEWRSGVAIVNRGSLPLSVTAAMPDDPAVHVDFSSFALAPGEVRHVPLDWHPQSLGSLRAHLRIESDAANAPFLDIVLTGFALNLPPHAAAIWPPAQIECAGPAGSEVVLDATPSVDDDPPPGDPVGIELYEWIENPGSADAILLGTGARLTRSLPLGTHRLALRVTDTHGAVGITETTVTVADTLPPVLSVAAAPQRLWPPNHRLVPLGVTWNARDLCAGDVTAAMTVRLTEVRSSEPDDAPGSLDGRTTGDILGAETGTADAAMLLRAERNAAGPGRVYTLLYVATDPSGNTVPGEVIVPVAPERRPPRR